VKLNFLRIICIEWYSYLTIKLNTMKVIFNNLFSLHKINENIFVQSLRKFY